METFKIDEELSVKVNDRVRLLNKELLDLFSNDRSILFDIHKEKFRTKEACLLQVAKQILNRDWNPNDGEIFQLLNYPGAEHEVLCYNYTPVGILKPMVSVNTYPNYNWEIGYQFTPYDNFKNPV